MSTTADQVSERSQRRLLQLRIYFCFLFDNRQKGNQVPRRR